MQFSITQFDPNYLVYAGASGILLGMFFFMFFLYRRIRRITRILSGQKTAPTGLLASLRNFILIIIWTSSFGMLLFLGFFLRAYHAFTYEKPVAEIRSKALEKGRKGPVSLVHFYSTHSQKSRHLILRGDQWMLEGDILKWESWLNFIGLHSRYRLTRLRGRYLNTEAEAHGPHTIYSLVMTEKHPFWRYLYQYGHQLPLVSTVYGNAVFQDLGKDKTYLIYVGISGFSVREKVEKW